DSATVRAGSLFVDRRESTLAEAGDYLIPAAEGAIGPDHIRAELGEILAGSRPGRTARDEITIFKSLGLGIEDLAAAEVALAAAPETLARGVVTASAGNMAQGVAWNARALGVSCTVVVPEHAPQTKLAAIERLGGRIVKVPFDRWWQCLVEHSFPGIDGLFVHP